MLQGRVEVDGAGFFFGEGSAPDPALLALRQRVLDTHGANFLTERVETLRRRLATLDGPEVPEPPRGASVDETPSPAYGFSRRYRDTLTALAALEVLATARPLRPEVTITAAVRELRLDADEALRLRGLSDALAASLVRLLDSPRPDWGFPLLLGMARLATLERSRESRQWVFLDAFPRSAEVIERARVARRPEVIDAMLSDAHSALDVALFGERVDMDGSLSFVPALSASIVKERYGVSDVFRILSHRRAGLARHDEEENSLRVFLREPNTITSTHYWRNSRDSTFVFFTDDVVVTRPVFGAANLVAGVAASAVGLVTAPFDRGKLLRASLRGAFFSLPELFFQNIRKGSFEYVGHGAREEEVR